MSQYSEPTKDIVVAAILLLSACILLGIGLGSLYYGAPGDLFSSKAVPTDQPAKTK
jgi:hypothetical protein